MTQKFVPEFWAETFWRLNTPSQPLPLHGLHTPVSAYCAGNLEQPYYAKAQPSASSVEASELSEPSEASSSDVESEHDQCESCGGHISDCVGCDDGGGCNMCGTRPGECECDDTDSSHYGQGPVKIRSGGEYGWRVKWDGDPQPGRDRSFRTIEQAEACKRAIESYMAEGEFLGAGRHRAGWLVGGLVVKVAMSNDGLIANRDEVASSQSAPIPVPDTAPLDEVTILAEYAPRLTSREAYAALDARDSPFRGHVIDSDNIGPQLGRLPNGKIVCFDYSTNV